LALSWRHDGRSLMNLRILILGNFVFFASLNLTAQEVPVPTAEELAAKQQRIQENKKALKETKTRIETLSNELRNPDPALDAEALKKKKEDLEAAKKAQKEAYEGLNKDVLMNRRKQIPEWRELRKEEVEKKKDDSNSTNAPESSSSNSIVTNALDSKE